MHLLPRMNVMLDFICMGPVDLPGAWNKLKLQNEKFSSAMAAPDYESNVLLT